MGRFSEAEQSCISNRIQHNTLYVISETFFSRGEKRVTFRIVLSRRP